MKIATIYNYQETCILCTLQCQELGATERQLSFKLCCSRDTARTMFQCISNNYQYPKYILSYLIWVLKISRWHFLWLKSCHIMCTAECYMEPKFQKQERA